MQVFLSIGDNTGTAITISWSSNETMESVVFYSTDPNNFDKSAEGNTPERYRYIDYTSGLLHHVTLTDLQASSFARLSNLFYDGGV